MNRLERAALLAGLARELTAKVGWCRETHLQKAAYFLQHICSVPTAYRFILYKHGPFSFDLQDELTGVPRRRHLRVRADAGPAWAELSTHGVGGLLEGRHGDAVGRYRKSLAAVAELFRGMPLATLERFAMALFLTLRGPGDRPPEERTRELHDLKPHVSLQEAAEAVRRVDDVRQDPAILQLCPM